MHSLSPTGSDGATVREVSSILVWAPDHASFVIFLCRFPQLRERWLRVPPGMPSALHRGAGGVVEGDKGGLPAPFPHVL